MNDKNYFLHPKSEWQRRYEALRASLVERLPAKVVAKRFNYSPSYILFLRHQFKHGKIDFSEPTPEGKVNRYRVSAEVRQKIKEWRQHNMSAGEITECLLEEGLEISVRTVERVLREEGFPKLPRRSRIKIGMTIKGAAIPEKSKVVELAELDGQRMTSDNAGLFLFAPFLSQYPLDAIVSAAGLPGNKTIPAKQYLLSFLALKLVGNERYSHAGDYGFDMAAGLFAGLNVLPKVTAMSSYSYSLDEVHIMKLQEAFVKHSCKVGLYDGGVVNLDFHTIPHYGEQSVLEQHWAGARNKSMKGALTLFAQDAQTKLILYTAADLMRRETDFQAEEFIKFWKKVHRGIRPLLVFDSKFTGYAHLSKLNRQGIKFITLRRRGEKLLEAAHRIASWKRISIDHPKRKYPNPYIHESTTELKNYSGLIRQVIVKGNGHEKPAMLITNDFDMPVELLVSNYARRWRVENGLSEAVSFFNLNALSSPILVKVHFDVVMTMIADTLYSMIAQQLRGFEDCNANSIYRHFIRGKAMVSIDGNNIKVTFPRRAHNPILRNVPWDKFPQKHPCFEQSKLYFSFM
ncbi:MAG: transposase [Candidatus Fischerbacteria bacterium RBG_13_37_8]|uniref:Transposase n=1 Tax=Candidatus Fischerbacteria bacterium RBG_13_37_8 TaxID=1817863 RepID=A0A1F5VXN7_9BACT|nr:MAG: transposase [Candidatus Fischerbacteria bacterium RBG_13_37_8]